MRFAAGHAVLLGMAGRGGRAFRFLTFGLQVVDELNFGPDYAETLRRWRESFMSQLDTVKMLKFDDRFIRLWSFYLAYCEAAFDEASIDVIQFTLVKPG